MMTASEIRQQFLDFFKSKGHIIVPSAPIVIKNDPTLLFTNAGMNQFKDAFLGNRQPIAPRVADTQKCLRVSGKHNDLEEVGVDTYHHTMFEMLGNWSFGDYFKKEAIDWSWELLTEVYKIPKEQLYVTVFEGDEKEGLLPDTEALEFWKAHIPESSILFGNKKDNFWEMGDTGPCGPCTEIHVDTRPAEEREDGLGGLLVNADHPQVIEIWNNVFMQYNRLKDGSLQPLPAQHVDTGMGFERLVRVLQQKHSNYDTDVFTGTIAAVESITHKKYDFSDRRDAIAFRVIADHIRAIAFTIADGQLPSNTGPGYVIRRILRRAVRYYFSYLNYNQPLLYALVSVLADQFKTVFPELHAQSDFVSKVIKEEEEAFLRTLDKGMKRMDHAMTNAKEGVINGEEAFKMYDTYGFPIDLTILIASENRLIVDEKEFSKFMQLQKTTAKDATRIDAGDWNYLREGNSNKFVGYEKLVANNVNVTRYRKVNAKGKELYQFVLDETPFYAESGGQVGDTGVLRSGQTEIRIIDTKRENDLIIHFTEDPLEDIDLSLSMNAIVDEDRRKATEIHHSTTHLLHAALRKVLGLHVAQKGSLVNGDQLRFDFSHFAKMTDDELARVEQMVNQKIRENLAVVTTNMSKEEAVALGAMALFGEKYGDVVRVVQMDPNYSIELCGGTHVGNTGELGFFKIKSEGAVAAGVRRIEALSGKAAEDYVNTQLQELGEAKNHLKNPKSLVKSIELLLAEQTSLRKKLETIEDKMIATMALELSHKSKTINGVSFLGELVISESLEVVRKLAVDVKNILGKDALVLICANAGGKAAVAIALSESVATNNQLDASKLIKEYVAPHIKGGGGGQKLLATAGGQETGALQQVIDSIENLLSKKHL